MRLSVAKTNRWTLMVRIRSMNEVLTAGLHHLKGWYFLPGISANGVLIAPQVRGSLTMLDDSPVFFARDYTLEA